MVIIETIFFMIFYFAVLRRVFSGRVQRANSATQLGTAPTCSRLHCQFDPATHPQISHNRYGNFQQCLNGILSS